MMLEEVPKSAAYGSTTTLMYAGCLRLSSSHFNAHKVHAVIYVVDASDQARLQEAAASLRAVYSDPRVNGKPLLMYITLMFLGGIIY
jgi:hypothetical protein